MQRYRLQLSFPKKKVIWTAHYPTHEEYEKGLRKHKLDIYEDNLMTHGAYEKAALISETFMDPADWVVTDVWSPCILGDDAEDLTF